MASFQKEFAHLEIQLDKIKAATNNFDDSNSIGVGGFGKVYKGEITLPEGKIMAAFKRLDRKHGQGDPEFFKEIRMLSCYKHKNLISLLGYCKEGDEMILMYEHASKGSLDLILNNAALTWTQRLKICLDVAKGLSFLHDPNGSQQRVIHRDIKSANILLDENLNAKISDFGVSKISPANQKYTFLFTSPVGTPGYCDPVYMDDYQLTKESDVYSFGVVLFEVLCGRVCYENINGKLKVFVPFWKECYEQKNLDEIIFPYLKQQMDPSSVRTFVDIAYKCLQESRKQRPTMSAVVEKLKAALLDSKEFHDLEHEQEEMRKALGYECVEIIRAADPPLIYKSMKELEALLSEGFLVKGGKTFVSVNDKGQVTESISIAEGFKSYTFRNQMEVRVRAQFLCPLITYSVSLVFINFEGKRCQTFRYKLDGETKCSMVYDAYEIDDELFMVPLYQFTSEATRYEIDFKGYWYGNELEVAGFEFEPLEEQVELHDQGLEEYQEIVKAASQSLFYKSLEELKVLLSVGVYLNDHKTWFSLNENGQHCEMLSIAQCLSPREGYRLCDDTKLYSRFPRFLKTKAKGFKVHIRTQFLTPLIDYTVNLVFPKYSFHAKRTYIALSYKLEGETETSIVYFAKAQADHSYIAELYQFTSNGRNFDLEIVFENHKYSLELEGILFRPLEKVEHEKVSEDENQFDSLQWTMKEEDLCINFLKWFIDISQEGYVVDSNGNKSLIFSARGVIRSYNMSFQPLPESRFQEVAVITGNDFKIVKKIKSGVLSRGITYACYLVYKSSKHQPVLQFKHYIDKYIYLVSPPDTPIIGQKLDQNTHNPLNRPKRYFDPRQRSDGWMEVGLDLYRPSEGSLDTNIDIWLYKPDWNDINGLIIQSIEVRPI